MRLSTFVLIPLPNGIGMVCQFIGIRTPWTLSSDRVWEKTNKLGGKLFKGAGVLALLGVFFPRYAILLLTIPIALIAAGVIIYSYILYRQETTMQKQKRKR